MGGYNQFRHWLRPNTAQQKAEDKLEDERRAAEAEAMWRYANLHMPEDIRSRAKAWRMEAFFEVLWNNAFQAGFREGMRDRKETPND